MHSQLFKHTEKELKNSGASRQVGEEKVVYLSNIESLSKGMQEKLAEALQPSGSADSSLKLIPIRIFASSTKNLATLSAKGQFHPALLNVFKDSTLFIPPLRDYAVSIPALVKDYLEEIRQTQKTSVPEIGEDALAALCQYSWPGNVRQLRNVIESAVILAPATLLEVDDLRLDHTASRKPGVDSTAQWQPISLKELEKDHISRVLDHVNWNKKRAAELLGIERSTLYSRIRNLQLEPREGTS